MMDYAKLFNVGFIVQKQLNCDFLDRIAAVDGRRLFDYAFEVRYILNRLG